MWPDLGLRYWLEFFGIWPALCRLSQQQTLGCRQSGPPLHPASARQSAHRHDHGHCGPHPHQIHTRLATPKIDMPNT